MAKFKQTALKPGRYHVGNGKYRDITREDIARYVSGTKAVLQAGNHVPLIAEHPEAGSQDGSPRDQKAAEVKHGAGWLTDIAQGSDGEMLLTLEATDKEIAAKLKDKSIRFTSPELRAEWQDGKGNQFRDIVSHVALTHKPRATDQGDLQPIEEPQPALQFSLADYIQLAEDSCHKNHEKRGDSDGIASEGTSSEEMNPDMPAAENADDQQFKAVIAHLAKRGVVLPSDTTKDTFWDLVLASLMTLDAADTKAEAEEAEAKEDDEAGDPVVEENAPLQFALADVLEGKCTNKLLSRVIKQEHEAIKGRLDRLVSGGAITPAVRDKLLGHGQALQFSADGDELPLLTLGQVVDVLGEVNASGIGWTEVDVAQLSAETHPEGESFYAKDNNVITREQAEAHVDKLAERWPDTYKKRAS